MTLGERIKEAREARHLSQEALAELLGVSRQAVSKWENDTAVPQGANRAALAEILELNEEPGTPAPQKTGVPSWLGWAAAGVLLLVLAGQALFSGGEPVEAPPTENAGPELVSVRFYDSTQEEVRSSSPHLPEYNAARMDSILLEWKGEESLESVKLFRTPRGDRTELAAEFFAPAGTVSALLLPAEALVRDGFADAYFELHFAGDHTVMSEKLQLYHDPGFEQHAYLDGFDGVTLTCDPVEWVDVPGDRADELGLSDEDGPNGFVLYNEQDAAVSWPVSPDCTYTVLDWADNFISAAVDAEEFRSILSRRIEQGIAVPYIVTVQQGEVAAVQEQYVP